MAVLNTHAIAHPGDSSLKRVRGLPRGAQLTGFWVKRHTLLCEKWLPDLLLTCSEPQSGAHLTLLTDSDPGPSTRTVSLLVPCPSPVEMLENNSTPLLRYPCGQRSPFRMAGTLKSKQRPPGKGRHLRSFRNSPRDASSPNCYAASCLPRAWPVGVIFGAAAAILPPECRKVSL